MPKPAPPPAVGTDQPPVIIQSGGFNWKTWIALSSLILGAGVTAGKLAGTMNQRENEALVEKAIDGRRLDELEAKDMVATQERGELLKAVNRLDRSLVELGTTMKGLTEAMKEHNANHP